MRGHTLFMPRFVFWFLFAACTGPLHAQQPTADSQLPKQPAQAKHASAESAKLASAIQGSYYHPDDISSIECDLAVDWPGFFGSLKLNIPDERMKKIEALKIHSRAERGRPPDIVFDWGGEPIDTHEQIESGIRQMLGGIYQMYWSMLATSLVKDGSEFDKVELLPDGAVEIYENQSGINLIMNVDKDGVPTHYSFDGAAMKGVIDPQYVASPSPSPGDLRRISSLTVNEQFGASSINAAMSLDYQEVDSFYIPMHVTFEAIGAYSVKMGFSACSVTSAKKMTTPER